MDRRYSLRGRRQFKTLYSQGRSWSGRGLRIRYLLDPVDDVRFAIATPRVLGKAVYRNRVRRVFKEAIRQGLDAWPKGWYHIRVYNVHDRPTRTVADNLLSQFAQTLGH